MSKDVSYLLRKSYVDLLNGNVSTGGVNVPIYDVVPNSQAFPYIAFGSVSEIADNDKDVFGTEHVVQLDIVTGFVRGGNGGRKQADDISSIVRSLISPNRTSNIFNLSPDFTNVLTIFENSNYIEEDNETHLIIRKIIEFRHLIHEN